MSRLIEFWPRERSRREDVSLIASTTEYSRNQPPIGHVGDFEYNPETRQIQPQLPPPSRIGKMYDLVGNQSTFKDCTHVETRCQTFGIMNDSYFGNFRDPHLWYFYGPTVSGVSRIRILPTAQLIARINNICLPEHCRSLTGHQDLEKHMDAIFWREQCRKLEPTIRLSLNDFDLVNFILQWKDAKNIIDHYLTKKGWVEKLRGFFRKDGTVTPGSIARHTSSEWLEHQYGTSLFVQDVKKLHFLLTNWKKRADDIIGRSGEQKTHRNGSLAFPVIDHNYSWSVPLFEAENSHIDCSLSYEQGVVLNTTTAYTYTVPEMTHFLGRIAQMCDTFGLQLDASIPWNAIKLSFVLDWFLNIGEFMHDIRLDWVSIDVTVDDYCRSGKVSSIRRAQWRYTYEGAEFIQPLCRVDTAFYRRERDCPSVDANNIELPLKGWSNIRLANATALILQRVPSAARVTDNAYRTAMRAQLQTAEQWKRDKRALAQDLQKLKKRLKTFRKKSKRLAKLARRKAIYLAKRGYHKYYRRGRFIILQAYSNEWKTKRAISRLPTMPLHL